MGAWGHGIRQDDFVCDVAGLFEELLGAGKSLGSVPWRPGSLTGRIEILASDPRDGNLHRRWTAIGERAAPPRA